MLIGLADCADAVEAVAAERTAVASAAAIVREIFLIWSCSFCKFVL